MSAKHIKQMERVLRERQLANEVSANENRARSVTVGTAFGGVTELMMRKHDGSVIWATMQPVEVIELIHQLSANIGCHLHMTPRNDFASWRSWKTETPEQSQHLNGYPPFANDLTPHEGRGRNLPKPELQPGLQLKHMNVNRQKQQVDTPHDKKQYSLPLDKKENVNE